ncbi:MAG: hypothetical protein ABIF85_03320 [Nanoarchaeota archaeon]
MPNDFYFEIAGTRFRITDLCPSLNNDFLSYHQSIFGFPVFNVNQFKGNSKSYFTSVKKDTRRWEKHDFYFGNFTIIWKTLLDQGKFREAENIWKFALSISKEWEDENKDYIHKGTPFYFWSVTCFLEDDIERGFTLMNQAYVEDLEAKQRHGRMDKPETVPAGLFLFFVPTVSAQFFKPKLDEMKLFLETKINEYSVTRGRTFRYSDFESKFLKNVDKDVIFHFNLNLFRLEKINRYPVVEGKNTIACLLYMEIIFDLCRVLDLIINKDQKLKKAIIDFAQKYKPNSNQKKAIESIKSQNIQDGFNTKNFIRTLRSLQNTGYTLNGYTPDEMEKDILISYGFRNLGAHEIVADDIVVQNYKELVQRILNSIFLAVELYY